jgi:hypothetical protein
MIPGRKPKSGRPAGRSLRDLERRLEASFDALADDLSVGRRFPSPRSSDRRSIRATQKGNLEPN